MLRHGPSGGGCQLNDTAAGNGGAADPSPTPNRPTPSQNTDGEKAEPTPKARVRMQVAEKANCRPIRSATIPQNLAMPPQ